MSEIIFPQSYKGIIILFSSSYVAMEKSDTIPDIETLYETSFFPLGVCKVFPVSLAL